MPLDVSNMSDRGCGLYELTEQNKVATRALQLDLKATAPDENVQDEDEVMKSFGDHSEYWDEITGEQLPEDLTQAARLEELEFMNDWHVWDVVPLFALLASYRKRPSWRQMGRCQ